MNKKFVITAIFIFSCAVMLVAVLAQDQETAIIADVYKSPTCNCCTKWVRMLESDGYFSQVHELETVQPIKDRYQVPRELRSCHTAVIAGYLFEGHVPFDLIRAVLKERPEITGLAVAGMPVGSPGMEAPGRRDRYQVVAFTTNGKSQVYAER